MKNCPECGGNSVVMFDADNDICADCEKWFPTVADVEEIYCNACSSESGAVYHTAPPCPAQEK